MSNRKEPKRKWLSKIGLGLLVFLGLIFLTLIVADGSYLSKSYLEPWDPEYANKFDDPRIQVIAHGLLAPNAHNKQSWKIRLSDQNPLDFSLFVETK